LEAKPWPARIRGYIALTGPGWLQSAITLGGGSLASSLYLGVIGGFSLLWLQPLAMVLGIIMLSAIGYVTLSTGERPFRAINEHINPVLGWGWAIASLVASMVWAMPQYSLATGVLQQNLLPGTLGPDGPLGSFYSKLLIAGVVLVLSTMVTWSYSSGHWGVRVYERTLKVLVAGIIICFAGVVVTIAFSEQGIAWRSLLAGLVPDFRAIFKPASGYEPLLQQVDEQYRHFWEARIVDEQRKVMISAAAVSVGINMTFLLPYSMLARGWRREHRGFSIFDLFVGMFIPFVLATSCIIIASAQQFHPAIRDAEGSLELSADGRELLPATVRELSEVSRQKTRAILADRLALEIGQDAVPRLREEDPEQLATLLAAFSPAEDQLAAAVTRRDASDLAQSLEPFAGSVVANAVFGIGVLGMTLSTITILMLISGFVVCEMFNLPSNGWAHRFGSLVAATGALGPFVWSGASFYLVVPTSVFGYTLIPIAYLTFMMMMNQRSLLGDDLPRGRRRLLWNSLMALAVTVTTAASFASVWFSAGWYGIAAVAAFLAAVLIAHVVRRNRLAAGDSASS
jgi:Mn2+/Fe2+ NRAMP family transporter